MTLKPKPLRSWLGGRSEPRCPDLGPRELETLDVLWRDSGLSAQELQGRLPAGGRSAITSTITSTITLSTVQSTLERLYRKGLAHRDKVGRAYRYRAAVTRAEMISLMLQDMSREIGGGDLGAMISGFADFVADDDPDIERKLTQVLERKEAGDE